MEIHALAAAVGSGEQDRFLAEHERRLRAEKMQADDRRAAGVHRLGAGGNGGFRGYVVQSSHSASS